MILKHESTGEFAIALHYIWDTSEDEQEAFKAFSGWLSLRFGKPDGSGLYVSDGIAAALQASKTAGFNLVFAESEITATSLTDLMP